MAPVRSMRTLYPRMRGADASPVVTALTMAPLPPRARG